MEQQNEYMIVMTSDGKFHRAEKVDHVDIGMEIQFRTISEREVLHRWTQVLRNNYTRAAVVAIIFLLMVFPVFSWYGSNQAFAYMNIDINPSVELELNDQMKVIDIIPQNEEAEKIVSSLEDWKKKDASEVTFELIELSQEKGYVNDANQVLIGISYLKEQENQKYAEEIETFLMNKAANISVATFLVPKDLRREAIAQKASVNEMVADRIKSEEKDQTGESELPVHVEDDDREIIQSFYKEESSEEKQKEVLDSEEKPTAPPAVNVKPENQSAKNRQPEQEGQKGKSQAPGQQKEKQKSEHEEKHIEKKDNENKHIEKKDHKNKHKENEDKKTNSKHQEKPKKPSPKPNKKEKGQEKGKGNGSKHNHKKDERERGGSKGKEKPPQGNGNSSNGKHS
ncbi:anti-sigma factor domain-containing protein [Halobacillus sp. HZG1]|nr:anti-sigma factor domain-containing protein [Halobacillus litoralis]MEC3884979.1 anti-sigma factor domain-containing protein [Halobacillus sp. HZG1]